MLLFTTKKAYHFCNTKLQKRIIKVILSNFSCLIADWTSYPTLLRGGGGGGYWLKLGVATCFLQCSVERVLQEITRQM